MITKPRNAPIKARMGFPVEAENVGVIIHDGPETIGDRVTAIEISPGIWEAELTAPSTSGDYVLIWDADGDLYRHEDLTVTGSIYIPGPGGEPDPGPDTPDDIALVRMEIGDEQGGHFSDEQLLILLDQDTTVLATAAHACEILATRYAGAADITVDGQTIKRSQLAAGFAARAKALRERAEAEQGGNIVTSVPVSARL